MVLQDFLGWGGVVGDVDVDDGVVDGEDEVEKVVLLGCVLVEFEGSDVDGFGDVVVEDWVVLVSVDGGRLGDSVEFPAGTLVEGG